MRVVWTQRDGACSCTQVSNHGAVSSVPLQAQTQVFHNLGKKKTDCSETSGILGVATLSHPRIALSVRSRKAGEGLAAIRRWRPDGSAVSTGQRAQTGRVRPRLVVTLPFITKQGVCSAAYSLHTAPPSLQPEPLHLHTRLSTAASVRALFRGIPAEPTLPTPESLETNAASGGVRALRAASDRYLGRAPGAPEPCTLRPSLN